MNTKKIKGRLSYVLNCERCNNVFYRQKRLFAKQENNKLTCINCIREIKKPPVPTCCKCNVIVSRKGLKCKKCMHLKERPNCADCGKTIGIKSRHCLSCHNKRQNKNLSLERVKFQNSDKWKNLRTECFERDKYICQLCYSKKPQYHAHHILFYYNHKEHRLNINNLLTMCVECHYWLHSIYGRDWIKPRKNNTYGRI